MLVQCWHWLDKSRRQWRSIKITAGQSLVPIGNDFKNRDNVIITPMFFLQIYSTYNEVLSQQAQNICLTSVHSRPNVFDVGPTLYMLYKCFVFARVVGDFRS